MRICSPSVPRLKHEWNHTVGLIINLRCGTAGLTQRLKKNKRNLTRSRRVLRGMLCLPRTDRIISSSLKTQLSRSLVERSQARIPKNAGGSCKYQTPVSSSLSEILLLSPMMNSLSVMRLAFSFLNRLLKSNDVPNVPKRSLGKAA